MRVLQEVRPSHEQMGIFSRTHHGVLVIRGAAGSGKTTTALLNLKASITKYLSRAQRENLDRPIRALVLTFNRTLRGYIEELASSNINYEIDFNVLTFAKWAKELLGIQGQLPIAACYRVLWSLCDESNLDFSTSFLVEEAEYVLDRFLPNDIENYLECIRKGRGNTPRVDRDARRTLLDEVVIPYLQIKNDRDLYDWSDLAVDLANQHIVGYDVIVVDETQDLSANQLRAIMEQLAEDSNITFIIDSAQKIYKKAFTWREVGINVNAQNSYFLQNNYRNTREIALFASGILSGIEQDDDTCLPNLDNVIKSGALPKVIIGTFSQQVDYAIRFILENIDLANETVAFLHPQAGGWFDFLRGKLSLKSLRFVDIACENQWPQGDENIALSSLHSAKGLEFDHVFILGLGDETLPRLAMDIDESDEALSFLRRLITVGVGRARESVMIGYKEEDRPIIADFFVKGTYERVQL